jgi:hypothetical protein
MPMNDRVPGRRPDAGADAGPGAATAGRRAARWLIAVLLLATAVLDLARCGMVLAAVRHPAPAAGLVAAGLAAAALSSWTARGCLAGRRWPAWAALLIGTASAPQAAASGFGAPYTIPDTATAAVGIVLAVAVLATAGRTRPGQHTESPCLIDKGATR